MAEDFVSGKGNVSAVAEAVNPELRALEQTLGEINALGKFSVHVVAVIRGSDLLYPASTGTKLQKGDLLVSIGSAENISRLAEHA